MFTCSVWLESLFSSVRWNWIFDDSGHTGFHDRSYDRHKILEGKNKFFGQKGFFVNYIEGLNNSDQKFSSYLDELMKTV